MNRSRSLLFKTYLIFKIGSVTKKLQLLKDGNKIEKSGKSKDVHEFLQGHLKMFVQICYYRFSILRYLRIELILFAYKDLLRILWTCQTYNYLPHAKKYFLTKLIFWNSTLENMCVLKIYKKYKKNTTL